MNEDFDALLFPNGNAMFFDEDGEQISELQNMGWPGVHVYLDRYPDAKVAFGMWDKGIFREMTEKAVKSISKPEEISFENESKIETSEDGKTPLKGEDADDDFNATEITVRFDGEEFTAEHERVRIETNDSERVSEHVSHGHLLEKDIEFTAKLKEDEEQ